MFFFSRFQVGLSWFQVVFLITQGSSLVVHGFMSVFIFFSRFQVGFSWCQVSFHGFSRFQVDFSWFKVVFHGFFMVPGLVFMIPGGFLPSLMVPGWFKSELSAGGAK